MRAYIGGLGDFNPRSRKGSDGEAFYTMDVTTISIHAPARGATDMIYYYLLDR